MAEDFGPCDDSGKNSNKTRVGTANFIQALLAEKAHYAAKMNNAVHDKSAITE